MAYFIEMYKYDMDSYFYKMEFFQLVQPWQHYVHVIDSNGRLMSTHYTAKKMFTFTYTVVTLISVTIMAQFMFSYATTRSISCILRSS